MSVAVVRVEKDYIELGADSIAVSRETTLIKKRSKIYHIDDSLYFAGVGAYKDITFFAMFAQTHKPQSNDAFGIVKWVCEFYRWVKDEFDYTANSPVNTDFLFVVDGSAYRVIDYDCVEIPEGYYAAIGAGQDYALAALHLGHDAHKAVTVACELSVDVDFPVVVHRIPRTKS